MGLQSVVDRARERPGPYRGTLPMRNRSPPYDPPTTLGIGLRKGLSGLCFLMSEVPKQRCKYSIAASIYDNYSVGLFSDQFVLDVI